MVKGGQGETSVHSLFTGSGLSDEKETLLIGYNRPREQSRGGGGPLEQSNNQAFQTEFRYLRDTGENGLFCIIWNTKRTQTIVALLTVSGHFVSVNMNSKNVLSVDSKNCLLRYLHKTQHASLALSFCGSN